MKWPAGIYRMIIQAVWGTFFYAPLFLFSQGQSTSSPFVLTEPLRSAYPLNKYVSWYAEESELSVSEVQKVSFQPISSLPDKLDSRTVYWVKMDVISNLSYPSEWKLQSAVIGLADFYFLDQNGQLFRKKSGFYRPKK
ncbi:MAG: 7TM-DISM domain-containing protein, partial [Bacteroidota bacterium]